ncbi:MAG: hypothetical protein KDA61_08995 [Planctomycetales bacterium]|nr:hypothetical protein [Planctomycetales bacterium]
MKIRSWLEGPCASARLWVQALAIACVCTAPADAATSLSDSLTGFSGDTTEFSLQQSLASAGFDVFSVDGLAEDFTSNPAVVFDGAGAHFGLAYELDGGGGDGGRNYIRTIESDYAFSSFRAEVTIDVDLGLAGSAFQQVFFGMGTGETALFGVPDWSTQNSSTFMAPEPGFIKTWSSSNDVNAWNDNDAVAGLEGNGVHRLQMTYNADSRTIVYSIDINYDGSVFVSDYAAPPLDLNSVSCPDGCGGGTEANLFDEFDGWPLEASSIYFGGDDGVIFRDFAVVIGVPASPDFDGSGRVDGEDFLAWQQFAGVASGATTSQGDANGDGAVGAADLQLWQAQFGQAAQVAALRAAPEPASSLLGLAGIVALARRRRVR